MPNHIVPGVMGIGHHTHLLVSTSLSTQQTEWHMENIQQFCFIKDQNWYKKRGKEKQIFFMFGSLKATWKINRYGFWYGILFRLVDIIVYFNLAALSVSVCRVTTCDGLRDILRGHTTRWNWQRCKLQMNNSINQVDQHFF